MEILTWVGEHPWAVWTAAVLIFVGIETLTLDLWFAMLAGGAVAALGATLLGAPVWLQLVVFAVASLLLILLLRPVALRQLKVPSNPGARTNVHGLPGTTATVLTRTGPHEGTVRLRGETWTARTDGATYSPGTEVTVTRIQGATAVVHHEGLPHRGGAAASL